MAHILVELLESTHTGSDLESEKLFCTKTTRISVYDPENVGKSPAGLEWEAEAGRL